MVSGGAGVGEEGNLNDPRLVQGTPNDVFSAPLAGGSQGFGGLRGGAVSPVTEKPA